MHILSTRTSLHKLREQCMWVWVLCEMHVSHVQCVFCSLFNVSTTKWANFLSRYWICAISSSHKWEIFGGRDFREKTFLRAGIWLKITKISASQTFPTVCSSPYKLFKCWSTRVNRIIGYVHLEMFCTA